MDGTVYSWGGNRYGQLGQDHTQYMYHLDEFNLVILRPWLDYRTSWWPQVSAGLEHTVCVTASGTMLSWGRGLYGRLGLGDTNDRAQPVMVPSALATRTVSQVSAGANHTMCVTACGLAFSWVLGTSGQLGLNDVENQLVPT